MEILLPFVLEILAGVFTLTIETWEILNQLTDQPVLSL